MSVKSFSRVPPIDSLLASSKDYPHSEKLHGAIRTEWPPYSREGHWTRLGERSKENEVPYRQGALHLHAGMVGTGQVGYGRTVV